MNMLEAVGSCFRKYFKFSGRARRSEFWYWVLFSLIASFILSLIDSFAFPTLAAQELGPLDTLFTFGTIFPGLAVGWRRLHDTGRSGWWIGGFYLSIIALLIIIGVVYGVDVFGSEGDPNSNVEDPTIWVLPVIIILGYGVMLVVFFCQDSHFGPNKYGPNPQDDGNVSVFD